MLSKPYSWLLLPVCRNEVVAAACQLPHDLTRVLPIAPASLPITSCLHIEIYAWHMLCHVMFVHVLAFKDTQPWPVRSPRSIWPIRIPEQRLFIRQPSDTSWTRLPRAFPSTRRAHHEQSCIFSKKKFCPPLSAFGQRTFLPLGTKSSHNKVIL